MRRRKPRIRPPLYHSWMAMRRCGGIVRGLTPYQESLYVGISVCPEWEDYRTFEAWAVSHGWQKGMQLTRRDKSKDFCPENCFLATPAEANGYRRCVRRLPDGRSARDLIGTRNLGRDSTEQARVAGRLFGWHKGGYAPKWNASNATAPKCRSRIDARIVRDKIARENTASGGCPEGRAHGRMCTA